MKIPGEFSLKLFLRIIEHREELSKRNSFKYLSRTHSKLSIAIRATDTNDRSNYYRVVIIE